MSARPPKGGKPGQKWVGFNHDAIEAAKARYGDISKIPSLMTSEFPHKDEWSEENLPDILFYVFPPQSQYEGQEVRYLLDENGKEIYPDHGGNHPIRDFEILPRHISLKVEGWLVETWRRIDTRIGYQDILDRQTADPQHGLRKLSKNALQNHCLRGCRRVLGSWVEYSRRAEPHRIDVENIERLSYRNITMNTFLNPCEIAPHRLTKVKLVRHRDGGHFHMEKLKVTLNNLYETTYPIDHFRRHLSGPDHKRTEVMSEAMLKAWDLSCDLSYRAILHELDHWSQLPRSCLPTSWYDRVKKPSQKLEEEVCTVCSHLPALEYPKVKSGGRNNKGKDMNHKAATTQTRRKRKISETNEENEAGSDLPLQNGLRAGMHSSKVRKISRTRKGRAVLGFQEPTNPLCQSQPDDITSESEIFPVGLTDRIDNWMQEDSFGLLPETNNCHSHNTQLNSASKGLDMAHDCMFNEPSVFDSRLPSLSTILNTPLNRAREVSPSTIQSNSRLSSSLIANSFESATTPDRNYTPGRLQSLDPCQSFTSQTSCAFEAFQTPGPLQRDVLPPPAPFPLSSLSPAIRRGLDINFYLQTAFDRYAVTQSSPLLPYSPLVGQGLESRTRAQSFNDDYGMDYLLDYGVFPPYDAHLPPIDPSVSSSPSRYPMGNDEGSGDGHTTHLAKVEAMGNSMQEEEFNFPTPPFLEDF